MDSMKVMVTQPSRQATMQLHDGRRLALSEWGSVDGILLLFCTPAGMSIWLGFGASALPNLGFKLIAIDRPGLGLSDPHPNKTLSYWVDDMREFLGIQNLDNVLAVGFSQGAPFAFALAGQGGVKALAIVLGQDELTYPRLLRLLYADVKGMIAAIQQDPVGFEQHFSQMATADGLWQLIIRHLPKRNG